ncbi:hypothetical protein FRC14_003784 [Serendipita sp. 396]|nr:hypothetical protein FRC14_003784 [Serendipita sp. 396]KAG8867544.1 hypothetical protein FRC20_005485 [Serendipita sp. 405]
MCVSSIFACISSVTSCPANMSAPSSNGPSEPPRTRGSITRTAETGREDAVTAVIPVHEVATSVKIEESSKAKPSVSHPNPIVRTIHDDMIQHHTIRRNILQAARSGLQVKHRQAETGSQRAKAIVCRETRGGTLQQEHLDAHTDASTEHRKAYNVMKENEYMINYHTDMINGHTEQKAADKMAEEATHAGSSRRIELAAQEQHHCDQARTHFDHAAYSSALACHSRNLVADLQETHRFTKRVYEGT